MDNGFSVSLEGVETNANGLTVLKLPMGASFTLTANVEANDPEGITYRWVKSGEDYEELTETGNSITGTVTGGEY